MKTLVFDSSALISLSETCSLSALDFLKKKSGVRFLAPESVHAETVETPLKIRKYSYSALRIKRLFDAGVVERGSADAAQTREIMKASNNLFFVGGRALKLIQEGEAACVAVMKQDAEAKFLAIDEKTLRLLVEAPLKLRALLQEEYAQEIEVMKHELAEWRKEVEGVKILRSAEVLAMAAQNGFFQGFGDDEEAAFHSAVFALRNAGCSLTANELAAYSQTRI